MVYICQVWIECVDVSGCFLWVVVVVACSPSRLSPLSPGEDKGTIGFLARSCRATRISALGGRGEKCPSRISDISVALENQCQTSKRPPGREICFPAPARAGSRAFC